MIDHIDRWNGNTMRRYHHGSGAILVISRHNGKRMTKVIPAWCRNIAVNIEAEQALYTLRKWRKNA